jgi:GH24 family phage-related lysozyme (muramidase)
LYADHKGIQTIGVGFNCERADAILILKTLCDVDLSLYIHSEKSLTLSDDHVEILFEYCIAEAITLTIHKLTEKIFTLLNAKQQCAIVSLVFNSPILLGPHLIHYLTSQQWQAAADEIRYHSNQNHDLHLQPRREREATLLLATHT